MSVLMVRAKIKADSAAEVEAAAEKMFAALEQAKPEGVRYASLKQADGVTFVALLQVDEGLENPLAELPAFQEFQEAVKDCFDGPPSADQLTVVGSYRLFD